MNWKVVAECDSSL